MKTILWIIAFICAVWYAGLFGAIAMTIFALYVKGSKEENL